jgi:hypothetical protein
MSRRFATSNDLPEVLAHSTLRLSNFKRVGKGIMGEGILVRLFPVLQKDVRLVGDSARSLWIVGDPNTGSGTLSKRKNAQQCPASKAQAAQARSSYNQRAKARVTSGKTKGRMLPAKDVRRTPAAEKRVEGDDNEPEDPSDEKEEDEHEEGLEEGNEEAEENEDTESHNASREVTAERNEVEDDEYEHDTEEQRRRKRPFERSEAFGCSISKERLKKRSKTDEGERRDGAATVGLPERTISTKATSQPSTSSPMFNTAPPGSTIAIVRQTSVVPGLEDTESAVWDAAQKDSVISSLSLEQQTKMVRTALSFCSKKGINGLRHFLSNARRDGRRGGKPLQSDFDLVASHPGVDVWHATGALVPRNSGLAHFSALYQQIDVLDNKATLFSITKRVKLAAMSQYRKGLMQEGAGKRQAKDINLYLFRAIYPEHATIERPDDKATESAAHNDWIRLRDRLREGRLWLDVRDLFGGVGAFLALPPQCVPDRHVVKMQAKTFGSWLRLLDVAWQALDAHARLQGLLASRLQILLITRRVPRADELYSWKVQKACSQWIGDTDVAPGDTSAAQIWRNALSGPPNQTLLVCFDRPAFHYARAIAVS